MELEKEILKIKEKMEENTKQIQLNQHDNMAAKILEISKRYVQQSPINYTMHAYNDNFI